MSDSLIGFLILVAIFAILALLSLARRDMPSGHTGPETICQDFGRYNENQECIEVR
jgi:hypothetical protein